MTQPSAAGGPERDRSLRCADADREAVVAELNRHFTEGRLTLEEFDERSSQAYAARTYADLDVLTGDLPSAPLVQQHDAPPATTAAAETAPVVQEKSTVWQNAVGHLGGWLSISLVLTVIWFVTSGGGHGYFWPAWVIGFWGVMSLAHMVKGGVEHGARRLDARADRHNQLRRRRDELGH